MSALSERAVRRLFLAAFLLGLLAAGVSASVARADGDPASDVLVGRPPGVHCCATRTATTGSENVFYPYTPTVASSIRATLDTEMTAALRSHFSLRVALIATPVDLGAISSLFDKPGEYAAFLDQEISLGRKVPLLVVMPNGYGTAGLSSQASSVAASLPKPGPGGSDALAEAAIVAVGKLAAAEGYSLGGQARAPTENGGGVALPLAIVAAVCVALGSAVVVLRRRRSKAADNRPAKARQVPDAP